MIPLSKRKEMIDRDISTPSLVRQCSLLSVHRSHLYYIPSPESEDNLAIMRFLDEQYLQTPFYGAERLLALLHSKGYHINRKRLGRLMRLVGWQTLYPQKRTTISDGSSYRYPYLLRDIHAETANQVWAVDITYIPMQRGYMYLFAIIDLYSRYVVGWSLSNTMSSQWCATTLQEAIARHGVPRIVNSDQGSQFTSQTWIDALRERHIAISMDGKGRAIDNVFIERLWRSVKYEYVYLHVCDTGTLLWKGLDEYFQFYNDHRLHQSLEYKTPAQYYPVKASAA